MSPTGEEELRRRLSDLAWSPVEPPSLEVIAERKRRYRVAHRLAIIGLIVSVLALAGVGTFGLIEAFGVGKPKPAVRPPHPTGVIAYLRGDPVSPFPILGPARIRTSIYLLGGAGLPVPWGALPWIRRGRPTAASWRMSDTGST